MRSVNVPCEGSWAKFTGEEFVDQQDQRLADVLLIEIFPPVCSFGMVLFVWSPIPLGGGEGVQMVVDSHGDCSSASPASHKPLVGAQEEEKVEQDDLV